MQFRKRLLVLPISAVVIGALVVFKLTQTQSERPGAVYQTVTKRPVPHPPFEALDSYNRLVKLRAFLGRHRIVLVFFDAGAGADRDEILQRIRQDYGRFKKENIIVLGISAGLPQDNRRTFKTGGEFPFRLLSDPTFEIHRQWGVFDEKDGTARPAVFWVDRAGRVAWAGSMPKPLPRTSENIRQIWNDS